MRILFFSDIHTEIRAKIGRLVWDAPVPLCFGPDLSEFAGRVDLALLAGDIGTIRIRRGISTLAYAEAAADFLGCPVVVVPGNHEYYAGVFDQDRAVFLAGASSRVIPLDRGSFFLGDGKGALRVLGATLWTDYRTSSLPQELAMIAAQQSINDHRLIRIGPANRPFLPEDALLEHGLSRAWLLEQLAVPHDGPTIIVTHHVPSSAVQHPRFGINPLSGAFCSDCGDVLEAAAAAGVRAWISGHDHWTQSVEVGGVPLLSAQLGYPSEDCNWQSPGILEL